MTLIGIVVSICPQNISFKKDNNEEEKLVCFWNITHLLFYRASLRCLSSHHKLFEINTPIPILVKNAENLQQNCLDVTKFNIRIDTSAQNIQNIWYIVSKCSTLLHPVSLLSGCWDNMSNNMINKEIQQIQIKRSSSGRLTNQNEHV